jgi:hypothetical protein
MLAWQCRMAFSMLDDVPYFFAFGYKRENYFNRRTLTLCERFSSCWNTYTE